jgi:predicted  nucleic acid-binding Zn-ribbon protein
MRTLAVVSAIAALRASDAATANPVRKVVTMLQGLQAKISAEGDKEKELYDKYMCYCKTSGGDLAKGIADAQTKIPQLQSDIAENEAKLAQLKLDVEAHKADRTAAKAAMATATALREQEKAKFDKENADLKANLAAIAKAVAAIEKGAYGFLQTSVASSLKKLVGKLDMQDADRQDMMAFLSGSTEYAPASGEIIGILKQMGDEMAADSKDVIDAEAAAVKAHEGLMAAKKKEVEALTKMIQNKLERIANLSVEIQEMKNDLGDSAEGLIEDQKFIADLEKNCADKAKLYDENVKYRTQELAAVADTIKILNDDDALELFKKTLPGSASFLQITNTASLMKSQALSMINALRKHRKSVRLDFIALSLQGKKIGFDKVIKMIDNLVAELKKDQIADDDKKEYCAVSFDTADDKKKVLEKSVSDLETAIADSKAGIATTTEEIAALEDTIKALDKAVAEATEQRKEENEEYVAEMASSSAAKELLNFAKNRLNKFYNPKLYKPPAKKELTDEDRGVLAAGGSLDPTEAPGGIAGTGIGLVQTATAPPPPPQAFKAYAKKGEESNGVIAMVDLLVKDLDKTMTEAEVTEKDAQEDYGTFMQDSANKRAQDSQSLADKEGALANLKGGLEEQTGSLGLTNSELDATNQYIHAMHLECDWLIKYYDMRKEARANEIDSLGKAKAVLNGADYSLLQTARARKFLRH